MCSQTSELTDHYTSAPDVWSVVTMLWLGFSYLPVYVWLWCQMLIPKRNSLPMIKLCRSLGKHTSMLPFTVLSNLVTPMVGWLLANQKSAKMAFPLYFFILLGSLCKQWQKDGWKHACAWIVALCIHSSLHWIICEDWCECKRFSLNDG